MSAPEVRSSPDGDARPPSVVLFSNHYLHSSRRAGFHALAHAFWQLGWNVVFVTAPISWISWVQHDFRFRYPVRAERNRLVEAKERLASFVLFTPYHPCNVRNRIGNWLTSPLAVGYAHTKLDALASAVKPDLVIMESTAALVLSGQIRSTWPRAKLVYRVSDNLATVGAHPFVVRRERDLARSFDLVSVPSEPLLARFEPSQRVKLQHHGIDTDLFDRPWQSPYRDGMNLCFVGNSRLDTRFLEVAAAARPEWHFHVVGPVTGPSGDNLHYHGELPFAATVPYVVHADAGLATLSWAEGAESFSESLKIQQFTYCGLPIIAPRFLQNGRSNMVYYEPGDAASIVASLETAAGRGKDASLRETVRPWRAVAADLARDAGAPVATP
jgi:2-beta-glucuronyltransferase